MNPFFRLRSICYKNYFKLCRLNLAKNIIFQILQCMISFRNTMTQKVQTCMLRLHDIKQKNSCFIVHYIPFLFLISCFIEAFIVVDCDILFYSKSGITGLMGFAH